MNNRVVITGMGVVAPNGVGLEKFEKAIKAGKSGIEYFEDLKAMNFSCCIGGIPEVSEALKLNYLTPLQLRNFTSSGILYACMAGIDAWKDAGLSFAEEEPFWDSGCIFGTGISGVDKMREATYKLDGGKVKRLGSNSVAQTMSSGVSAYLGGIIGLGNQVTTNSSACATGTEAILLAFERIQAGKATRMIAGSSSEHGPYIWGGFDAMRVMTYKHNETPTEGSRPMSATASGFVPGSGGGALILETLESALARKAPIYGEILGGAVNSGGQRNGGTMTAPNSIAVQRCISAAIKNANIDAKDIDLINGHLTATVKDPVEIENWTIALDRRGKDFPYIHSLKSMIGHCLSGAGAIESVAAILGLKNGFIFPNINCEDLHPEILNLIDVDKIPKQLINTKEIEIIAKASFGFGDVNTCLIFKKMNNE
ncbi:MAG: beta-ketoacyl synthase [Saprospiraceae bacterium]